MSRAMKLLRRPRIGMLLLLAVILFVVSCSTVAVTGRRQLIVIPQSQMMPMSFEQYEQVLQESTLSTDRAAARRVKKVGVRIQNAVEEYFREQGMSGELDGYEWEFNLIASEQANAWCMPGGKVAFYTGILPVCGDETGIAVVMGHEVAHAIAEHGSERMSQALIVQLGGVALSEALNTKPEKTRELWLSAFGMGTQLGAMLPFSRLHESEADHLGLIFMAMAGYDPAAAESFWQRMADHGGGSPPEFLSTHPANETRIRQIREWLPEALTYYKP